MFDLLGYGSTLIPGIFLTIQVALISLLIALILGMLGALAKLSSSLAAKTLATVYTTLIRGVPDLVLMLLIFFGGQTLVNQLGTLFGYDEYIDVNPYIAGVLTIGFIYGAYMAETFRGAILAVPGGQIEAGYAFGMSAAQVFRRITLPQMIRHALPGFGNNWLVLLKGTAIISIIGLDDIVRKAALAAGATQKPFTFYLAVAIVFLLFTTVSVVLLRWAEHRYSAGYQ
jgi:arginine/ornithine transport system permease protein